MNIPPFEVIIQENLENTISNEYLKFEQYLNNNSSKCIIATLYNNHLIAIDGNKLCTISRLLNKKICVIILDGADDFEEFRREYDTDIYTSRLLNYENYQKFEQNLFGSIENKDYFFNKQHQIDFKNCIKENFNIEYNHDIQYQGKHISMKINKSFGNKLWK